MKRLKFPYWYMLVQINYDSKKCPYPLSTSLLEVIFKLSLNTIFGEIGSAVPPKVLKFDPILKQALVRVCSKTYAQFRAALTLLSSADIGGSSLPFSAGVVSASPCLLSLAAPFNPLRCAGSPDYAEETRTGSV